MPDLDLDVLGDGTCDLSTEWAGAGGVPGGGGAAGPSTAAHSFVGPAHTLISFVGNSITHLVLINSDEDWGSLLEKQGFEDLDPSTGRFYGCQ